jgi:STE24 endopeptidase
MTMLRALARRDASRRRGRHFAVLRALATSPEVLGSLMLLVMLFGWLGPWEVAVLVGWLITGAAMLSRDGERLTVRVGYGFHRPSTSQAQQLEPAWTEALRRCSVAPGDVDLYVKRARQANAYATGGRAVAVTTGALAASRANRLADEHLVALLVHELGHHATRSTRLILATNWLAAPWRIASQLLIGFGMIIAGRQPRRLLGGVVIAGVIVAPLQAEPGQRWMIAAALGGLVLALVACPLADAAVRRRSEFAADRFAVEAGLGPQLATVLERLDSGGSSGVRRWLATHPTVERRTTALRAHPPGADRPTTFASS